MGFKSISFHREMRPITTVLDIWFEFQMIYINKDENRAFLSNIRKEFLIFYIKNKKESVKAFSLFWRRR